MAVDINIAKVQISFPIIIEKYRNRNHEIAIFRSSRRLCRRTSGHFALGIDAAELARRMEISVETIEKLLRFEIPLTENLAKKLEQATWMNANLMLRHEKSYRASLAYAMEHPEIPAYLGDEIVNQQRCQSRNRKIAQKRPNQ